MGDDHDNTKGEEEGCGRSGSLFAVATAVSTTVATAIAAAITTTVAAFVSTTTIAVHAAKETD